MYNKLKLYINTLKYLRPSQIYYRPVNRTIRILYKRNLLKLRVPSELLVYDSFNYIIRDLDFDREYLNRFDIHSIVNDEFTFLNLKRKVNLSNAWNSKELQQLWRYNLHYFEYLYKLALEYESSSNNIRAIYYDKFKYLIENWIDNNPVAFGDGWHPYTISLRITNWISVYQIFKDNINKDKEFNSKFINSLYLQFAYLQKNLEKDVLGNHYFENIKALIIGSIFFQNDKVKSKFIKELIIQLDEQILNDGMHFELSPMYHKIILEDLIKITFWLRADKVYNVLISYIQKMISVTYSLEEDFGKTPAFNDSSDDISKGYNVLIYTCKKYFNLEPEFVGKLENSGFYIIKDKYKHLIFDTGEICPSYLPAHGHCDALSFELSVDKKPIIVNLGTCMYEKGAWRDYFRSTKAHNTVSIDELEQSYFWGSFRVANRIRKVRRKSFEYKGVTFYAGAYVSYKGNEHKRFIGVLDEYSMIVIDYVKSGLNAESYLHFAPGILLNLIDNEVIVSDNRNKKIKILGAKSVCIEKSWYSEQFNKKEENTRLIIKKDVSKGYFGYLINLSSSNLEILETENKVEITGDKNFIIDVKRLEDIL